MKKIKAEFNFPANLKDEPIICELCKKFDIILSIIEASFSTDTGWAILILQGNQEEVNNALAYLKERGIGTENIQEIP